MAKIDNIDYKTGDISLAAIFICNGATVKRIDRILDKYARVRVLFVFDKNIVVPIEANYLSYSCQVDARKYTDTLANLKTIIANTAINITKD
jgi:hypothetical protein